MQSPLLYFGSTLTLADCDLLGYPILDPICLKSEFSISSQCSAKSLLYLDSTSILADCILLECPISDPTCLKSEFSIMTSQWSAKSSLYLVIRSSNLHLGVGFMQCFEALLSWNICIDFSCECVRIPFWVGSLEKLWVGLTCAYSFIYLHATWIMLSINLSQLHRPKKDTMDTKERYNESEGYYIEHGVCIRYPINHLSSKKRRELNF